MWETGTECDVSITCFRLGKSQHPRAFPLLEGSEFFLMLFLLVILRSYIARLKVVNYDLEDQREESLRLCPFYSDYTNGVGQHSRCP